MKLKTADTLKDAILDSHNDYLTYLTDSADRMNGDERRHYTNDDRREMKHKIEDARIISDLLPEMLDTLTGLAGMTTEEEYGDDCPPSEDWICTLSEMIMRARKVLR